MSLNAINNVLLHILQERDNIMKILSVISLLLFINPAIADGGHSSLYDKSAGYGKSGGYERSGGYETSVEGYRKSTGHERSIEGYKLSEEGYEHHVVNTPVDSKRIVEKKYQTQMEKASVNRNRYISERHIDEGTIQRIRSQFQASGGTDDLIEE